MTYKNPLVRLLFGLAFLVIVTPLRVLGGGAVIGTIAGSLNVTVGGAAVQPNTAVFSGDTFQVEDGAAVVATNQGSRVVLGRDTVAEFLKGKNEVLVVLRQGNVSLYHPGLTEPLRVRLGAFSIVPARGFSTLGDVAMINGAAIVSAKQGVLRVESGRAAVEVVRGETLRLSTKPGRTPQGAPSAGAGAPTQHGGGSSNLIQWIGLGVGAMGGVFGAVAISDANSASSTANKAETAAATAASVANSAVTAADAAATAAQTATEAAGAAAATGELAANAVGCDLNKLAASLGQPSPYKPFPGFACH